MRYDLEGLDPNTLKMVEELRKEIRELAERKSRVGVKKQYSLDRKILANKKRLGELTGQIDPDVQPLFTPLVTSFDTPIPPTPQRSKQEAKKRNQWVHVFPGGAPGSGKRS